MKFRRKHDGAEIDLAGGWELVPCDPPEVWRDVTAECEFDGHYSIVHRNGATFGDIIATSGNSYRLRKVEVWQTSGVDGKNCRMCAFIVEKLSP